MAADVLLSRKLVFLFKSSLENGPDKYSESLESAGHSCCVVSTLSFQFINQDVLKSHVKNLDSFSAVIFTSVRAVQSVINVAEGLGTNNDFAKITCYVVGESTAQKAKQAGFNPVGDVSGNAQALSEFILSSMSASDYSRPILYPCSSIRRDKLSQTLKSHGVPFTEVFSYDTCANENLERDLRTAIKEHGLPDYAVFFSPSCLEAVLPIGNDQLFPLDNIKLIALGPTTDQALRDAGFSPFAVTKKPNPESLRQALFE